MAHQMVLMMDVEIYLEGMMEPATVLEICLVGKKGQLMAAVTQWADQRALEMVTETL